MTEVLINLQIKRDIKVTSFTRSRTFKISFLEHVDLIGQHIYITKSQERAILYIFKVSLYLYLFFEKHFFTFRFMDFSDFFVTVSDAQGQLNI